MRYGGVSGNSKKRHSELKNAGKRSRLDWKSNQEVARKRGGKKKKEPQKERHPHSVKTTVDVGEEENSESRGGWPILG